MYHGCHGDFSDIHQNTPNCVTVFLDFLSHVLGCESQAVIGNSQCLVTQKNKCIPTAKCVPQVIKNKSLLTLIFVSLIFMIEINVYVLPNLYIVSFKIKSLPTAKFILHVFKNKINTYLLSKLYLRLKNK